MANTLYGAMSGARPVNWGKLIHQYVEKSIPHIGRKPSYLSPYILHLYQHYDCFTGEDEDLWTIAADEVVYKLGPETEMAETGTEDSSNHAVRKHLPSPPHPGSGNLLPHHHLHRVRKPDPTGRHLGGMSTYPPGTFRKLPSSGSTTNWRNSRPSVTGWSTSLEERGGP